MEKSRLPTRHLRDIYNATRIQFDPRIWIREDMTKKDDIEVANKKTLEEFVESYFPEYV